MTINNMDEIPWAAVPGKAFREYVELSIRLIEEAGIIFDDGDNNPKKIAINHLAGKINDDERKKSVSFWSDFIEKDARESGFRNRDNADVIKARLALGLLCPRQGDDNYSESLDWVMIFLEKYGADGDHLWACVERFFEKRSKKGGCSF